MTSTVHWDLDIYALSSISHKDDSTSTTTALFRRRRSNSARRDGGARPDHLRQLLPRNTATHR